MPRNAGRIPVPQFDPNVVPAGSRLYGVYDGSSFHVTANRASAIQRVYARSECSVWESSSGRWIRRGLKDGPNFGDPCGRCNMPLHAANVYSRRPLGEWCFVRGPGGKINDPLELVFMCPDCARFNES